jgi:DNA helicase HerA-like ATPase
MTALNRPEFVGVVLGSQDSTPLEFWIAVGAGQVQLDDVVVVKTTTPDGRDIEFFGNVDIVKMRFEGAQFDTDTLRAAEGLLPVETAYTAHVQVTRIEPEEFVPPQPGSPVQVVRGEEFQKALFIDQMEHKLPVGLTRSGDPLYVNLEFLDGTRGAHVSISGVSGVATKTTFATFMLYSLFHSGILGARSVNTRAIIFNVKGEDLLWLDKPNARLTEAHRADYQKLGLSAGAFESVRFYAPTTPHGDAMIPATGSRQDGVLPYAWTLREFAEERLLRYAFADADERSQVSFVIERVESFLVDCARKSTRGTADLLVEDVTCKTFADLVKVLDGPVLDRVTDTGRIASGTVDAFRRRLHSAAHAMGHLVRGGEDALKKSPDYTAKQVTVVDIHTLRSTAQMFVVGVILKRLMEAKESQGTADPRVYVVLDELNKYAPRKGSSPISDVLLDIAERGRSMGVCLLGAQQTASEVERRVVSNAAIRVVGRLDSAEATRDEYGYLGKVGRLRASMLRPGSMLVTQPEIPTPVLVQFPWPSWATRADEVVQTSVPEHAIDSVFGRDSDD